MACKAVVSEITGFSTHDGPGIRTTVFLKGCPLRCAWCSNPETWQAAPCIFFVEKRCVGCGACVAACQTGCITTGDGGRPVIDRMRCVSCGDCARTCLGNALQISGVEYSVDDVFRRVERDKPFYGKDGGLTVSGGEPLVHADFVEELFKRCRDAQISTVLDTTGYADPRSLLRVLEHTDLVLLDIKHMDAGRHERWTGVSNELIVENARMIAGAVKTRISFPLIPGVNDDEDNVERTAAFAREIGVVAVDINPLHKLGASKYRFLGMDDPYDRFGDANPEAVAAVAGAFAAYGIETTIGRMM